MKSIKGFTLIEILVSVALFSVVMVVALGSLLAMSTSDRKAESLKSVINNLNFTLDSMSRSIRTGSNYHCGSATGQDCITGSDYFAFTDANNNFVEYKFDTSGCPNGVGCIERQITPPSGSPSGFTPITAPEVMLTDFASKTPPSYLFYVQGSSPGPADTVQPRVVITLSGTVQVSAKQSSTLYLQTSVTQRLYDQ